MIQVVIISNHHMFSNGLASLLENKADIHIIAHHPNPQHTSSAVQMLQPDVVVVDDTYSNNTSGAAVMPILRDNPDLLVIGLNLHSNDLQIYQAEQRKVETTADLLDVLQAPALNGVPAMAQ